ncbi:MAG TPA: CheR family methyltransferase [Terriglobales bacterium]|nr:CheR family methyltransferase [Terriglobales bacterium]
MHRLMAGVTILEHELSELRLIVERQTGILLDCPNSALVAHVAEYLESHELDSAAVLLDRLRAADQDPLALPRFLDGVLNVNTGFYRHPGAMNALARQVAPQLYARKSEDGACTLRIWSAGCGTGEEPYSIAMALCDPVSNGNGAGNGSTDGIRDVKDKDKDTKNKDAKEKAASEKNGNSRGGVIDCSTPAALPSTKDWSVHIVGSDLLPSAIEAAERGLYPQSALTGLPPATIRACFSKIGNSNGSQNCAQDSPNGAGNDPTIANGAINGNSSTNGNGSANSSAANGTGSAGGAHLLVKPRLRSLVTFNTMNLTKPVYIGRFDCIFCMDVLPHLSRAQRTALLERLHLYLEPGGFLFLSQTEKLQAPNLNFRSETFDGYTFHRKPLAASAAYGR